ncbi:MAG: pyruvate:ferredoxin (flavodoxin) oxidoreductase [Ktedonobacterales bacterium]|nr:pyruvate:ferredoxin (flavodoxin) oxidoreductase [Ktedonobacterales bacterium]
MANWITIDGNEAAARVAHAISEVIAIYPITPSTPMGELADAWSAQGKPNLLGTVPTVIEMQSEGGAAGAIHGALQTGALTTTFTASQGLLLMIPNMFKIAGELSPTVFHVAARAVASHALSIFGDHADVMAARPTGFALLSSHSVQEAQDLAVIAHAATLAARIPFLHFFDGFRTSHEIDKIVPVSDETLRSMIDDHLIFAHRERSLSPEHPTIRGTAQNPDVYFQGREAANAYYAACPGIVQVTMDRFAALTGRHYHLFDYEGSPDAERVIVIMGSGAITATETAQHLAQHGEKVGVLRVHLFHPFASERFIAALPPTVRAIAVLDRTKEPGSVGEPCYLEVVAALHEDRARGGALGTQVTSVIGGRYGLGSKEFTPAMVKAVYEEMAQPQPKAHFTVGIIDDVTHLSLAYDPTFTIESPATVRCIFWGLGSDGTVGANKNSIKIIGEETPNYAQGYFVYDSKKSGSITVSHLRFGPQPIAAPYLIEHADFIACHHATFLNTYDVVDPIAPNGVLLLNTPFGPDAIWEHLPARVQQIITERNARLYVIDAGKVAHATGMSGRINTVMQTCFFAVSGALPRAEAIAAIKHSIAKTYGKRGEAVVQRNFAAVDQTLAHLAEVDVAASRARQTTPTMQRLVPLVAAIAPAFVRDVLGVMIAGKGDTLPISALPVDGTYPIGTAKWEKRDIGTELPVWDPAICIQCGKCTMVCPHAVIRMKVYDEADLTNAPATFQSTAAHFTEFPDKRYSLQVSPQDCTSCSLCVAACPVKDKTQVGRKALNMAPIDPLRAAEQHNWEFFTALPEMDPATLSRASIKNVQLLEPLFEFSGACSGCGETPYIKLVTQLFGDHMVVANATGCSSIYGGNLPTTPWTANRDGRGPAWANSLFEDNAEFGLGMRVTLDQQRDFARELLQRLRGQLDAPLVEALLGTEQTTPAGIKAQREQVATLKERLAPLTTASDAAIANAARQLLSIADTLVRRSVWIIGGDGWAYDIGFGGLDHVLASGKNVNILVLDTEVYSNTGGQASKATPLGAVAKFAARGKAQGKKDLAQIAMSYGHVYVAQLAMGASDMQTQRAIQEAEAFDGPSLLIAYSHCIAHGIDMTKGLTQQRLAVQSGEWLLFRYDPARAATGQPPLVLDAKAPSVPLEAYAENETRFRMLRQSDEAHADELMDAAREAVQTRWQHYQQLAMVAPTPQEN